MNDGPSITVVVPVYNVADYVAEALTTILSQTRPPFDPAIVAHDGSTRAT